MTSHLLEYTSTGTETPGVGHLASWALGPWSGSWSFYITWGSLVPPGIILGLSLWRGSPDTGTGCWHEVIGITSSALTTGVYSETVTPGSPDYACVDFDHVALGLDPGSDPLPAGMTWSIHIDADTGIPTDCPYGTELINGNATALEVGLGAFDVLGIATVGLWALPLVAATVASPVLLGNLCSQLPPGDRDIAPSDWNTLGEGGVLSLALEKVADKFTRSMWKTFCHCKPATPGGTPPAISITVNWNQPTSYITNNNTTITENNLSITINNMLRMLGPSNNAPVDLRELTQLVKMCCAPHEYSVGTDHDHLTGDGSFTVSGLYGVEVRITSRPSGSPTLEGDPPYRWNVGWMTINTGVYMLEERRITRDNAIWINPNMAYATRFNYWLYPDVEISVTELLAVLPA